MGFQLVPGSGFFRILFSHPADGRCSLFPLFFFVSRRKFPLRSFPKLLLYFKPFSAGACIFLELCRSIGMVFGCHFSRAFLPILILPPSRFGSISS